MFNFHFLSFFLRCVIGELPQEKVVPDFNKPILFVLFHLLGDEKQTDSGVQY